MKKINMKNYFSKNLYFEALNQTKITGLFLVLASIILCSLFPFTSLVQYMQYSSRQTTAWFVNVMQGNVALITLMYLIPMFLAFNGFEFLSKRKACDFYHAIPVKRESLFCSFAFAGVTWLVSCLTLGGLCSVMLFAIVPNLYVPIAGSFVAILAVVCGALMIYFASLLAISASGNKLTQIMLAIFIVFMPQVLQIGLASTVDDITNISIWSSFVSTVPFSLINSLFGRGDLLDFFSASTLMLTVLWAVIYAILAGLIFTKRKSELAGNNAPNKFLQHIYRIILMLPFALFFSNSIRNASNMFSVILVVFAISFVIYIGYELATTKNYKTAIKSIPYYGVVIAITAVFLLGTSLCGFVINQITPSAENINYVQISSTFDIRSNSDKYYEERAKLKVEDEKIIEIVSSRLQETIDAGGFYYLMEENGVKSATRMYVTINTGLFSYERKILISSEEADYIENYYANQTQLNEYIISLPEKEDVLDVDIYGGGLDYSSKIPEDVKATVIDMMYEEFNSLSKEEQYKILLYNSNSSIMPVFAAVDTSYVASDLDFRVNMTTLGAYTSELSTVYITSLMPKTYEYLIDYSYENQSLDTSELDSFKMAITDETQANVYVKIADDTKQEIYFSTVATNETSLSIEDCKTIIEKTQEILSRGKSENLDNLYFMVISMENMNYKYDYYGDETVDEPIAVDTYFYITCIVPLTEEDISFFKEMEIKKLS